jgi:tetratricopeptide (TPR) repeat protein
MSNLSALELKDLGNEAFKSGNHAKALDLYSEAISKATRDTDNTDDNNIHLIFSNRAAAYLSLQRFEEALVDCDKVLELSPRFTKGYLRKTMALRGLGRKKEALEVAKTGLALEDSAAAAGQPELSKLSASIEKELAVSKAKAR